MKPLFFLFSLFLFALELDAQLALPKPVYDQVKWMKLDDQLAGKQYYRQGSLVAQVNYRVAGKTSYLCGEKYYRTDSVLQFFGDEVIEFLFTDATSSIQKKTWYRSEGILVDEFYSPAGIIKSQTRSALYLSFIGERAENEFYCDDLQRVLEVKTYDGQGKQISHLDYAGGTVTPENKEQKMPTAAMIALMEKADSVVKQSYGVAFFSKHLVLDYRNIAVYDSKSNSYHRNQGMPDRNKFRSWFANRAEPITYIDFSYGLKLKEHTYKEDFVIVRLDAAGHLVDDIDRSTVVEGNFTEGLLVSPCAVRRVEDVGRILNARGIQMNGDSEVTLTWKAASKGSARGTLSYAVSYNDYERTTLECQLHFKDVLFIDACTGELTIAKDVVQRECSMESEYRSREMENGKSGFKTRDNVVVIPFDYDELPSEINYCNIARKGTAYGCIDHRNKLLLPFEYERISYVTFQRKRYQGEYLLLKKGGLYGMADDMGAIVIPVSYSKLELSSADKITGYLNGKSAISYDLKKKMVVK